MPKKKKHSPRTPKFTRSKLREYSSYSLPSSKTTPSVYPESSQFRTSDSQFVISDLSQSQPSTSITSSTPIACPFDSQNTNMADDENKSGDLSLHSSLENSKSESESDSVSTEMGAVGSSHNLSNTDNVHNHDQDTGSTDDDSLFSALKSQNIASMLPFKSMLKELLEGFNHQLRLEIKTDMIQLLEANKLEISEFKTQIDSRISSIDSKIDSNISDMNAKMNTLSERVNKSENKITKEQMEKIENATSISNSLSDRLEQHISSTKTELAERKKKEIELIQSLDFISKDIQELQDMNAALTQKNEQLEITVDNQCTHNKRLKTQVNSLVTDRVASEVRQRKLNLVFEGLAETAGDNPKKMVTELLQKTGDLPNAADIDVAYRLGKIAGNSTRPILVTFLNQETKDNILKKASKIKQSSEIASLWINRDLPDLTRRQTANTRRCFNLMKANKHECSVHGTSITYKKKVYQYNELNNLPIGSCLEDTRQVPCDEGTGICFQSELSYLSSFYPAPLTYRNKEFVSAEQAFQWARAIHAKKFAAAHDILVNIDPYTIKRLGEEVGDSEPWKLIDVDTLRSITYLKFKQNRGLNERLRTTEFTKFYECTTSQKWGTGIHLPTSREIDTSKFTGSNHLGIIIADVKEKLINEHRKNIVHSSTSTSTSI